MNKISKFVNIIRDFLSKDVIIGEVYIDGNDIHIKGNLIKRKELKNSLIITKSEKFVADSLRMENLFAEVSINTHDEEEVFIEIIGQGDHVSLIDISNKNGLLLINGERADVSCRVVEVDGEVVSGNKLPSIKILAPFKTNISVADIFGRTAIGEFGGKLEVRSDMGDVDIAKTKNASLRLCGMGNLTVRNYDGFLGLHNSGYGAFRVLNGNITGANIIVEGIGKARVPEVSGDLTIKNTGYGNIYVNKAGKTTIAVDSAGNVSVNEVNGDLTITNSGQGDVTIEKGLVNKLYIKITGIGNAVFGGQANKADLNSIDMGNIIVEYVKDRPYTRRKGMGDIEVKNWDS